MTILNDIQQLLNEKERSSTLKEPSSEDPNERLLVPCENPHHSTIDLLEITAHPQHFEGIFTKENTFDSYYLLQFQFLLPLEIFPEHFHQLSSSLHFFNRLLHCPGFELDELNDQVLFRYMWFVKRKGIDSYLLMQVIGNMQLCFEMFRPYIQEIAAGKYKLEDILKEVVKLSKT